MFKLKAFADWLAPRGKSIATGLGALAALYSASKADGLTVQEVVDMLLYALLLASVVYAVPNATVPLPSKK